MIIYWPLWPSVWIKNQKSATRSKKSTEPRNCLSALSVTVGVSVKSNESIQTIGVKIRNQSHQRAANIVATMRKVILIGVVLIFVRTIYGQGKYDFIHLFIETRHKGNCAPAGMLATAKTVRFINRFRHNDAHLSFRHHVSIFGSNRNSRF